MISVEKVPARQSKAVYGSFGTSANPFSAWRQQAQERTRPPKRQAREKEGQGREDWGRENINDGHTESEDELSRRRAHSRAVTVNIVSGVIVI